MRDPHDGRFRAKGAALIETVPKVSWRQVIHHVSWRLIHQNEREVTESISHSFTAASVPSINVWL